MFVDPHCHLNLSPLIDEFDDIILELKKREFDAIINIGVDLKSSIDAVKQANRHDIVYSAVGFHPSEAKEFDFEGISDLIKKEKKIIAIGEIGLDYYWDKTFNDIQKDVFEKQIELALKNSLPIIVHSRDAKEDTFKILEKYKNEIKGIFHCFSYDKNDAEYIANELGLYVAFCGNATYKKSNLKESIEILSLQQMFVETDSPYLSPIPYRGKTNYPYYVVETYKFVSKIKNIDLELVKKQLRQNFKDLFGI